MAAKKPVLALAGVPRVNLMPVAEIERRERVSLTRRWVLAAIAAVAVGLVIIGAAFALRFVADQRLAAERDRTGALLTELSAHSDVSAAVATRGQLQSFRAEAMAKDAAWTPMLALVAGALPAGTTLVEFGLAAGNVEVVPDPTTAIGYTGMLTFATKTAAAQAVTVEALRATEGVLAVDAGTLTAGGEDGFEFTVPIAFDQTVFSGLYTEDEK